MGKERSINIDVIKCIAIISVICVHFFLYNGFYGIPVYGLRMLGYITIQSFFLICVPLFVIATGYLMKDKTEFNLKYVLKLNKVIIPYVIISIFCLFVRIYNFNETIGFVDGIKSILSYSASNYGWYVNMYITLYLLIPFLNIFYKSLKGQKNKLKFLGVMFFLVVFVSLTNVDVKFLPDYMYILWPFLYYFVGCYLAEYKVNIRARYLILSILLVTIFNGIFQYIFSYGDIYKWTNHNNWGGFIPFINSVLIFILVINTKMNIRGKISNKIITSISSLTLNIYLVSYLYDLVVYDIFPVGEILINTRIKFYLIGVVLVFVMSYISAILINYIYKYILKLYDSIKTICINVFKM